MGERGSGNGRGGGVGDPPSTFVGRASLGDWAVKLRGEVDREGVIHAPGPGHSDADRSLSVWLDENAPQGFRVHSFAIKDEDFTALRDYVRDTCNAPEWKPPAKADGRAPHREAVAHYVYDDIEGNPVLRVTRYAPKAFAQSKPVKGGGWEFGGVPNKARVPYKLPEVVEAGANDQVVFVVEGEKAVLKLWSVGLPATCSSGGAGKWPDHFAKWFEGFRVIVLADHDTPGRKHAEQVRENLEPVATWVRVVNLPGLPLGGDVVDWIEAGNDPATIVSIKEGPPQRGHTAEALWDMVFPPIKYAVPGYIAEGLTLFAGAPKRGKSWLALDVCIAVASGGYTLGDQKCTEGDVLYCALEDSPRRMTVWFGADLPRLGAGCEELLREWLSAQPHPRLIVLDTLNYIRPDRTRDEDPYSYDYRSATTLQRLAQDYGIAIIIIHHTRKTAADDYLESISGTNGLTGGSDAVMVLEKGTEGGFVLKGRGRDIQEFEAAMKFDKEACRWSVLGDATEARTSDTRAAILGVLRTTTWVMTVSEIAAQVGRARNTVDQQLFKMVKEGVVERHGRGKYAMPGKITVVEGGRRDRFSDDDEDED